MNIRLLPKLSRCQPLHACTQEFAFKEDVFLLQGVGSESITESLLAHNLDFAEWVDNQGDPNVRPLPLLLSCMLASL